MLAPDSSSVLRPKPPQPVTNSTLSLLNPRPTFLTVGPKLSLNSIKMEALRRMGGFCFKNPDPRLKVEADSGGEDFYDAAAVAKPVPHHLVIMVNGIIGSAADWRYAAEQFVRKLPDKVIVHLNAILQD